LPRLSSVLCERGTKDERLCLDERRSFLLLLLQLLERSDSRLGFGLPFFDKGFPIAIKGFYVGFKTGVQRRTAMIFPQIFNSGRVYLAYMASVYGKTRATSTVPRYLPRKTIDEGEFFALHFLRVSVVQWKNKGLLSPRSWFNSHVETPPLP
jgi:hypothetical protein